MSKISNSDATYCSEAEEYLEQNQQNGDIRRSERILEKCRNEQYVFSNQMNVGSNALKPVLRNRKRSRNCVNLNDSKCTKSKIYSQNGLGSEFKMIATAPSGISQVLIPDLSGVHQDAVAISTKDHFTKEKDIHCGVVGNSTHSNEIAPQQHVRSIGKTHPLTIKKDPTTKNSRCRQKTTRARTRRKPQHKASISNAAKNLSFQNNQKNFNNCNDDKDNRNPSIDFLNRYKSIRPKIPMANKKRYYAKATVLQSPAHITPISESLLPPVYPPHFTEQLIPVPVSWRPVNENVMPMLSAANVNIMQTAYPTPDFTENRDLDISSTSTPSLPDSLRSFFDTDDIREILSVEKVVYRLNEHHVQILAFLLNMRLGVLRELLERILRMNSNFLHNIHEVVRIFPEMQFAADNISDTSEIPKSQSPTARYLVSQRKAS